ncbi:MAG: hypothetical protein U0587_06220 [Candidatus Binatia bacterium]
MGRRAVFTIAVGKLIYLRMACALARSFRQWHGDGEIPFFLVTDAAASTLPRDVQDLPMIRLVPNQYGRGFAPKLYLDKLAPADSALFVDADCLCVGSLESAFDAFAGQCVSVIGREVRNGEWFGDVRAICRQFGVPALPRFNGGVYYLERGETCTRVYETARALLPRYDEIGFKRLRGSPNDEVLISLAMALHGQKPLPERGDIMNSLLAGPCGVELDVFAGHALLRNFKGDPRHNPWYEQEELRPRLVHFLGGDIHDYPYQQEVRRLALVCERRWPRWLATTIVKLTFSWPWLIRNFAKRLLRPLFHRLFGPRRQRPSGRF